MLRFLLSTLTPLGSLPIAFGVLLVLFGPSHVMHAMIGANPWAIALALVLGACVQVLKAKRATIMLSCYRDMPFLQSFGAMVVGNGLGDLLPLGPTGLGVRAALTQRMAGIPIPFSSGVFLADGTLDGIGMIPLMAYLLLLARVGTGLRMVLGGVLVQTIVVLLVPLLVMPLRRAGLRTPRGLMERKGVGRLITIGCQLADGLATVAAGGWRRATAIVALSLAVTGLTIARLVLLLVAFGLSAGVAQLLVLTVLMWFVGSMPLNIPGSGTWAAARMLRAVNLAGSGASGFVLVSRALSSAETPLLGCTILAWWTLRGGAAGVPMRDLLRIGRGLASPADQPIAQKVRV